MDETKIQANFGNKVDTHIDSKELENKMKRSVSNFPNSNFVHVI